MIVRERFRIKQPFCSYSKWACGVPEHQIATCEFRCHSPLKSWSRTKALQTFTDKSFTDMWPTIQHNDMPRALCTMDTPFFHCHLLCRSSSLYVASKCRFCAPLFKQNEVVSNQALGTTSDVQQEQTKETQKNTKLFKEQVERERVPSMKAMTLQPRPRDLFLKKSTSPSARRASINSASPEIAAGTRTWTFPGVINVVFVPSRSVLRS